MALIIEVGTGVDAANSYASLAEYTAYASALGWVLAANAVANEINLRRAFQALNRKWTYKGEKLRDSQAGAFPRTGFGVPKDIKDAQCELAYLIQGGLDPFGASSSGTTSESIKIGPITLQDETFPTGQTGMESAETLLRPYRNSGAGQVALARA